MIPWCAAVLSQIHDWTLLSQVNLFSNTMAGLVQQSYTCICIHDLSHSDIGPVYGAMCYSPEIGSYALMLTQIKPSHCKKGWKPSLSRLTCFADYSKGWSNVYLGCVCVCGVWECQASSEPWYMNKLIPWPKHKISTQIETPWMHSHISQGRNLSKCYYFSKLISLQP